MTTISLQALFASSSASVSETELTNLFTLALEVAPILDVSKAVYDKWYTLPNDPTHRVYKQVSVYFSQAVDQYRAKQQAASEAKVKQERMAYRQRRDDFLLSIARGDMDPSPADMTATEIQGAIERAMTIEEDGEADEDMRDLLCDTIHDALAECDGDEEAAKKWFITKMENIGYGEIELRCPGLWAEAVESYHHYREEDSDSVMEEN